MLLGGTVGTVLIPWHASLNSWAQGALQPVCLQVHFLLLHCNIHSETNLQKIHTIQVQVRWMWMRGFCWHCSQDLCITFMPFHFCWQNQTSAPSWKPNSQSKGQNLYTTSSKENYITSKSSKGSFFNISMLPLCKSNLGYKQHSTSLADTDGDPDNLSALSRSPKTLLEPVTLSHLASN